MKKSAAARPSQWAWRKVAQGVRYSETLRRNLLYVAVPVAAAGVVDGAVRITYPTSAVDARITRYWLILLAIAAVVMTLAAAAGTRLARFVTGPLRGLERAAVAVGDGDLGARAPDSAGPPEVRSLAAVFNQTVARLEELLRQMGAASRSVGNHLLETKFTLAITKLKRDIVFAASLYL